MHKGHEIARRFFSGTSSTYDRVVKITTFGYDAIWKGKILEMVQDRGKALDLACGTGILTLALAEKVPFVLGIDLIENSLRIGMVKAKNANVLFINGAAEAIPLHDESIDLITASYLPKYCDIDLVVKECARVLRNNGLLIMHDFTYPLGLMRLLWHTYFKILRIAGVFVPSWRDIFSELDEVIRTSRWDEELISAMERNGFRDVACKYLTMHTAAIVHGKKY